MQRMGVNLSFYVDFSEAIGKLNKIKVVKDGEVSNVCLA